jgi:hypothetical protein
MEISNGVYVLDEEDVFRLLQEEHLTLLDLETILLYREDDTRPIAIKEIKPFPKGSHHAIVPASIGKISGNVILLPAREEELVREKGRRVFKGRIVIFSGEDICILLVCRKWELAGENICLTFVKKGTRPLAEKRVAQYSTRGYHVIVPMEIAQNYDMVFMIPSTIL